MNEEKDRDKIGELLKQELLEEAEVIRAEVNRREDLKAVTAPDEIQERLMKQIQKMEEERQVQERLSEEDKESMRLGREVQFQKNLELLDVEEKPVSTRKKRPWKVFLLIAAAATLILAMGLTSFGGPPFILNMMDDALGEREMTRMDSEREGENANAGEISEEEKFYQEVKDTFGINIVRMLYLPTHTKFIMGDMDEVSSQASIFYQCEEMMIEYQVVVNYQTRSYGYDIEDELISEKELFVSGVPIIVKEYKLPDGTHQFVARFEYGENAYILNSTISQEEFEKILNNLKFF